MDTTTPPNPTGTSTRPYLIRALHDWCTDNGFTPYLAVFVDATVRVPLDYVKNNEIVLNVGFEATSGLQLGNDTIEFKGRFGGVAREIVVPVDHVIAIYARENGQGMAFPVPTDTPAGTERSSEEPESDEAADAPRAAGGARGGLRLASSEPAADVPPADVPAAPPGDDDPPDAPSGGSGRPSLKRVK